MIDEYSTEVPALPLRTLLRTEPLGPVPAEVLDATALRPLMNALIDLSRRAIADFDEVFGERA